MLTDTQEGRLLLNEAAYSILRREAPEELPAYVLLRDRYLADPQGFARPCPGRDEALGFGSAAAVQTLTQALFPLLAPMLLHIVTQAALALQDEGGKRAAAWVRGLFQEPGSRTAAQAAPQPQFSQAQLNAIRLELAQIAENEGRRLGIARHKVARVQDALLARLALATVPQEAHHA
jgi:hypothetical protein